MSDLVLTAPPAGLLPHLGDTAMMLQLFCQIPMLGDQLLLFQDILQSFIQAFLLLFIRRLCSHWRVAHSHVHNTLMNMHMNVNVYIQTQCNTITCVVAQLKLI